MFPFAFLEITNPIFYRDMWRGRQVKPRSKKNFHLEKGSFKTTSFASFFLFPLINSDSVKTTPDLSFNKVTFFAGFYVCAKKWETRRVSVWLAVEMSVNWKSALYVLYVHRTVKKSGMNFLDYLEVVHCVHYTLRTHISSKILPFSPFA